MRWWPRCHCRARTLCAVRRVPPAACIACQLSTGTQSGTPAGGHGQITGPAPPLCLARPHCLGRATRRCSAASASQPIAWDDNNPRGKGRGTVPVMGWLGPAAHSKWAAAACHYKNQGCRSRASLAQVTQLFIQIGGRLVPRLLRQGMGVQHGQPSGGWMGSTRAHQSITALCAPLKPTSSHTSSAAACCEMPTPLDPHLYAEGLQLRQRLGQRGRLVLQRQPHARTQQLDLPALPARVLRVRGCKEGCHAC